MKVYSLQLKDFDTTTLAAICESRKRAEQIADDAGYDVHEAGDPYLSRYATIQEWDTQQSGAIRYEVELSLTGEIIEKSTDYDLPKEIKTDVPTGFYYKGTMSKETYVGWSYVSHKEAETKAREARQKVLDAHNAKDCTAQLREK
jgi:hypothetical protein